jgi:hypothetical protein
MVLSPGTHNSASGSIVIAPTVAPQRPKNARRETWPGSIGRFTDELPHGRLRQSDPGEKGAPVHILVYENQATRSDPQTPSHSKRIFLWPADAAVVGPDDGLVTVVPGDRRLAVLHSPSREAVRAPNRPVWPTRGHDLDPHPTARALAWVDDQDGDRVRVDDRPRTGPLNSREVRRDWRAV